MGCCKFIDMLGAQPLSTDTIDAGRWLVLPDHSQKIRVQRGSRAEIILAPGDTETHRLELVVERGAELRVVQVVTKADYGSDIDVDVHENATCVMTQVVLTSAVTTVKANLIEPGARFELGGAFILKGEERGAVSVDVKHLSSDCVSRTTYKGVASDKARGKFSGLVYVATDAQRTDSEQLSRNVTIGEARIETLPQLEIYADDVKCSHGATVGQMDEQAILYMRQRGLSYADAKRLQVEGFVADVVLHTAIDDCREGLLELLQDKL